MTGSILDYIIIAAFVLSGISLVISVVLFFYFGIPGVIKDMRGSLEKKQIEEIRVKNTDAAHRSSAVSVFEELQQKAKPRSGNTQRIKIGTTASLDTGAKGAPSAVGSTADEAGGDYETVVLKQAQEASDGFVIEKKLIFVSTTDVLA